MNNPYYATSLVVWSIIVHLQCDWLLQNDWMARNKASLRHPAAWVHGAIHFAGLLLIFSPLVALFLALLHVLIDTRVPLRYWFHVYGQSTSGPAALHVSIWCDQVLHILVLALVVIVGLR